LPNITLPLAMSFLRKSLVQIIIQSTISSSIFEIVSSDFHLLFLYFFGVWVCDDASAPDIQLYSMYVQCGTCTYTVSLKTPEIDSKDQTIPIRQIWRVSDYESSLLANYSVWLKHGTKPDILKNSKKKNFYSSYSNETSCMKVLEYQEYFNSNCLGRIL
jgi:hypothetical protein